MTIMRMGATDRDKEALDRTIAEASAIIPASWTAADTEASLARTAAACEGPLYPDDP